MKKVIGFFARLLMCFMIIVAVTLAVRLFNYSKAAKINAVLFQPAQLWQNRIPPPVSIDKKTSSEVLGKLIEKFAIEYLSVVPDSVVVRSRSGGRGLLRLISASSVFSNWSSKVLPELVNMAEAGQMRRILVDTSRITKQGDYFVVPFSEVLWSSSNDIDANPVISSGKNMYIKLYFNKKVRDASSGFDAGDALDAGIPAPAIFEFIVLQVVIR